MVKANPQVELNDEKVNRKATLAGAPTKLMLAEIKDDEGNIIGHKLVSDVYKFGEEEKQIVCQQLASHGRLGTAARAAGVTVGTVKRHVKSDSNFAELIGESVEVYKDQLLAHHQELVFNGTQKVTYDRNGGVVSTETIYPIRLIELELKKHDPGYRDKQEVTHEHRGGVMVAPAEVTSVDDWEARFGKAKDVTPEDSQD